jgi:hypothetical protein
MLKKNIKLKIINIYIALVISHYKFIIFIIVSVMFFSKKNIHLFILLLYNIEIFFSIYL